MKRETLHTLRDPRLVQARTQWFDRLRGLFGGQRQQTAFVLHGIQRYTEDAGPGWERWLDESLDKLAEEAERSRDERVFRPLSINYNPRGVHFTDHLFGADVFLLDGESWQVHPLDAPVGSLEPPDLSSHPTWQRMKDFTRVFLERDVPAVLFGLPTIASVLNVAVNLYGDRILLAMLSDPQAARHDLRVINDVLCDLHRWYLGVVPAEQLQCILPNGRCQPPGYGQLCGCTTQLVSGETYREFIAPLDDELLSLYSGGGMIHLCGRHTQHIPAWNEMASLRSLQLNDRAAEDLAIYCRELRDDVVLYVNPCEGMPVERIVEITGGQRVLIAADLEEPPSIAFLECERGMNVIRLQKLPLDDLEPLVRESREQGLDFVERLVADYVSGANRFDLPGEALFAVYADQRLIAVGGLNRDPYLQDGHTGRVRRLYVLSAWRRRGVGRRLVQRIVEEARLHYRRLTLRTLNPEADSFYRALGFQTEPPIPHATHRLDL